MRHLRTHAASVAIVAGLGILGVGCTDDDDPTAPDETTAPADAPTTDAPTTDAPTTDAPTSTESPTS